MSIVLRILLIMVSVLNCFWVLTKIRKSQMKIESSVFWILFSVVLMIISAFPQLVFWGAEITGVQSPTNFIYLAIIFILIVKVFRLSMYLSQLEVKLNQLIQQYALDNCDEHSETESFDSL